jgi:hypothetical protein
MQAMSIGLAIWLFDAKMWIDLEDPGVNGVTYAMAAFAVQGLAYYIFKMFFQQSMDEKARIGIMERERRTRYRSMETTFDRRRQDMELRTQETQLEMELQWMEHNPGKTPPWIEQRMSGDGVSSASFIPETPKHIAGEEHPLKLGISFDEGDSSARDSNGKFKKKE